MKFKYIFHIITAHIFYLLIFVLPVNGQVKIQDKCLYHFNDLQRKQTWTESYNAAGINFIDFKNSSYIEAYMGKNDGSFVKYYESENGINFGLRTESYARIRNITYYGKLDYNKFFGQNMTWSGLIYPERYLLTVADDIPAEKVKESYLISSGFSAPIVKNLLLGFKFNYEVANLAKRKDLRHKTDLLDIELSGGLIYKADLVNFGVNYYYRKFHENVDFSKIAKDEINYNGYLFKGLWFGINDTWSQDVLKLSRPFLDIQNGCSVQVEFASGNIRFFNEFTYKNQDGLTGPGADKEYTQSQAETYEYKGIVQYEKERFRHYFRLNTNYTDAANYDKITNRENIGGIYVVQYYGLNKTFSRWNFSLNPEYELAIGKYKYNPSWNITAGYDYSIQSSVSSLIYPYYFSQTVAVNHGYIKANKNFMWQKGMVDFSLSGSYSKGNGDKLQQYISVSGEDQVSEDIIPYHNENLLNREYEFLTAGKFKGEAGLRYSRFLNLPRMAGSLYIDARYLYTTASDLLYHPGDKAGMFSLALGFSF
ncbi:MAG: hypothetical protein PHP30_02400 [Bacteroidales bacterium]|nr:hypothetical protein [Bacteroidales bacterium]MDD2425247.1 hypothetical protein [Bacteroidales bacterium]MDD3988936.1 hypothetical protein [Bacteroidales bacterium]MDD4638223.1 hypothetical protein [Bacteroidales bacterium]